jgi:alkylhydroperoxidase/carboxymuconolactone decarboxylase family protein YurZ
MIDLNNVQSDQLKRVSSEAGDAFKLMRKAVASGPLDEETRELILLSSFACVGIEPSFKVHALKARMAGISREKIQHAILITLGATTALMRVTEAIRWLDDAEAELGAASKRICRNTYDV